MSDPTPERPIGRRLAAGLLWYPAWAVVIYLAHHPWDDLGGLVGERLRWLERFSLSAALVVGWSVGQIARGHTARLDPVVRAHRLRVLLYPVAAPVAAGMLWMQRGGYVDGTGVLFVAALAYAASSLSAFLRIGCRARPTAARRSDDRASMG